MRAARPNLAPTTPSGPHPLAGDQADDQLRPMRRQIRPGAARLCAPAILLQGLRRRLQGQPQTAGRRATAAMVEPALRRVAATGITRTDFNDAAFELGSRPVAQGGGCAMTARMQRATRRRAPFCGALAVAAAIAPATSAVAQQDAVAAFYRGRTVQAVVGYTPGSTFELYLRMFVRHLGRHVPGNPNIVVQHMPGAGSLKATACLAGVGPRDGSVIGIINPVTTIEPLIDPANTKFDPRAFMWLGSLNSEISTCGLWAKDLRTLADLKRRREVVVGSTGPASGSTVDAKILGPLAGINFKVVTSYPGLTEV